MEELLKRLEIDTGLDLVRILKELERKQVQYLERLDNIDDDDRRAQIQADLDEMKTPISIMKWILGDDEVSVIPVAEPVEEAVTATTIEEEPAPAPEPTPTPELTPTPEPTRIYGTAPSVSIESTVMGEDDEDIVVVAKEPILAAEAPEESPAPEETVVAEEIVVSEEEALDVVEETAIVASADSTQAAEAKDVKQEVKEQAKEQAQNIVGILKEELGLIKELFSDMMKEKSFNTPCVVIMVIMILLQIIIIL